MVHAEDLRIQARVFEVGRKELIEEGVKAVGDICFWAAGKKEVGNKTSGDIG